MGSQGQEVATQQPLLISKEYLCTPSSTLDDFVLTEEEYVSAEAFFLPWKAESSWNFFTEEWMAESDLLYDGYSM